MTSAQPVTKRELDEALQGMEVRMEKMVGQVVGEIVGEALQLISNRFDKIEARLDKIEDKLENTIAIVNHHTADIRQLKRRIA